MKAVSVLLVLALVAGAHCYCAPTLGKDACNSKTEMRSGSEKRVCAYCEGGSTLDDNERCMDINVAISLMKGGGDHLLSAAAGAKEHCHFEGVDESMHLKRVGYCFDHSFEECPEFDDNGSPCIACSKSKKCQNKRRLAGNSVQAERDACMDGFCEAHGPCQAATERPQGEYCWQRTADECTTKNEGKDSTGHECAVCGGANRACDTLKVTGVFASMEKLSACPLIQQKYCTGPDADPRCPCGANDRSGAINKCLNDENGGGFGNIASATDRRRCAYCARTLPDGSRVRECRSMKWVNEFTTKEQEGFDTMACIENRAKVNEWWGKLQKLGYRLKETDRSVDIGSGSAGNDGEDDSVPSDIQCSQLNSKTKDCANLDGKRCLGSAPALKHGKTCADVYKLGMEERRSFGMTPKDTNYCQCAVSKRCEVKNEGGDNFCVERASASAPAGGDDDTGDDDTDGAKKPKKAAPRGRGLPVGGDSGEDHWAALEAFVAHVKTHKKEGFCEQLANLDHKFIRKASDLTGEWALAWRAATDACNGVGGDEAGSAALVKGLKMQKEAGAFCGSEE